MARGRAWHAVGFLLVVAAFTAPVSSAAQTTSSAHSPVSTDIVFTDSNDLAVTGGKAETVEYQGRKAMRLVTEGSSGEAFAFLKGIQMQDGTIEADIAMKTTTPPGVRRPGFLGIAFRTSADASHYDLFYLRPGNSQSQDQAMRNHAVQYVAAPGNDWYRLRRQWPWVYESYADLQPEHWSRVRIEIHGRIAKLFVDGNENPSLIVDGLKGENLHGGIALWGYAGEEAYFSNVKVLVAEPQPVTNGGEVAGNWTVDFASDYGRFKGSMDLQRQGNAVTGTWSGDFGDRLPVSGTWRDGYVELTFLGTWPEKQAPAAAMLAGWIDGDSAGGRMKVEGRADGKWSAQRRK